MSKAWSGQASEMKLQGNAVMGGKQGAHIQEFYLQELNQALTVKLKEKSPAHLSGGGEQESFLNTPEHLFYLTMPALNWNYFARA